MALSKSFLLPFIKKELVALDTYSFYFDRTHAPSFDFLPGQYIRLTLPHDSDERGTSRFFTISSSPLQHETLVITARIYQSSFKEQLLSLQPGYEGQFFGPLGTFVLDEALSQPQVFLSGGIGITPFHSMLLTAAQKKLSAPLTLLAAFSKKSEMVFFNELTLLAQKNPQIRIVYTFSNSQEYQNSEQYESGRISEALLRKHIPNVQEPIYSLVGSLAFVAGVREMLLSLDVSAEQIRSEDFTGY